jgi:hypothetical protein
MSKKTTKTTELSTKGQFSQKDVPSMLEIINKKIAALKGSGPVENGTDGNIPGIGSIKTMSESDLIKAASTIIAKEKAYKETYESLFSQHGKMPEFKLGSYTVKQYLSDIERQYVETKHKAELTKLEKAKKDLEECLSAEDKLAKTLASIAASYEE